MQNLPNNLSELKTSFATEEACRVLLYDLKWPGGIFQCPKCRNRNSWKLQSAGLRTCKRCRHQTSVTAGTLFERTHQPLTKWFCALWWVAAKRKGATAVGFEKFMDVSYKTAWTWLHKIRHAMVRPESDLLTNEVHLDVCWLGIEDRKGGMRRDGKKVRLLVASESTFEGKKGGIRIRRIPDFGEVDISSFARDFIAPNTIVFTNNGFGYADLVALGFRYKVLTEEEARKKEQLWTASAMLYLYKWLSHAHRCAVNYEHLDYYLAEFCFRSDHWSLRQKQDASMWYRLLQNAMAMEPLSYKKIIGK